MIANRKQVSKLKLYLSWIESGEGMFASEERFDPDMFPLSGEVLIRLGR